MSFFSALKGDLGQIGTFLESEEEAFVAYVSANGGIEAVIASMEAKIASSVSILTLLSGALGVPSADMALLAKAFAAVQGVEAIVSKVEALIPAAPPAP
jgi:hypothetical protein